METQQKLHLNYEKNKLFFFPVSGIILKTTCCPISKANTQQ